MNIQAHLDRFQKESPKGQLLAISSNLRRLSNLAYNFTPGGDPSNIETFLAETEAFLAAINEQQIPNIYRSRFEKFKAELPKLKDRWPAAKDNKVRLLIWAEKMLTWSNLLD